MNAAGLSELWHPALTLCLIAFLALPSWRLSRPLQYLLLLALAALTVVEINGISLAIYIRSVIGDLAVSTFLALCLGTLVRLGWLPAPAARQQTEILLCFAGLALLLYPATLGLTYFDPYRLGYSPRPLLLLIGLITLVFIVRRNLLGALLTCSATLAFRFELKDSSNYWDYLIDPGFGCYCLCVLALKYWRSVIPLRFLPARYR